MSWLGHITRMRSSAVPVQTEFGISSNQDDLSAVLLKEAFATKANETAASQDQAFQLASGDMPLLFTEVPMVPAAVSDNNTPQDHASILAICIEEPAPSNAVNSGVEGVTGSAQAPVSVEPFVAICLEPLDSMPEASQDNTELAICLEEGIFDPFLTVQQEYAFALSQGTVEAMDLFLERHANTDAFFKEYEITGNSTVATLLEQDMSPRLVACWDSGGSDIL